jgi:23S rRNA (cytidine2498-2'-O)-methyltransferase
MSASTLPASGHLLRISQVFHEQAPGVLRALGATSQKLLGQEYYWTQGMDAVTLQHSPPAIFVRWHLPVHHAWPCNPQKMEGFIEKAAQALRKKFGGVDFQAILVGQLSAGSAAGYYRQLASNLRGRVLQLFPEVVARGVDAESQDPTVPTLFCLVGKEGLFCGVETPRAANGFHPGGTRFIAQDSENTISRAGAKIAEALHYLPLHRPLPPQGSHWIELGASPGGMTSELLERGYHVTAVDRAPLDARLRHHKNLHFAQGNVAEFHPPEGVRYDALLCDLNGEAAESMQQVLRLSPVLQSGSLIIFTLKMPGVSSVEDATTLLKHVCQHAASAGLRIIARTHLSYNRHEFTLFLEKV